MFPSEERADVGGRGGVWGGGAVFPICRLLACSRGKKKGISANMIRPLFAYVCVCLC